MTTTSRRVALAAVLAGGLAAAACSSSDDSGTGGTGTTPATSAAPIPPNTAPSDAERAGTTSTTSNSGAPTTTTTAGGSSAAAPRCATSQLQVTMRSVEGEAGAGHQYRSILFTNSGAQPCLISGFPGVSFLDAAGAQLGPAAVRDESVAGTAVTLAPGAVANAVLDGSPGELYGPDECGTLAESASLRVYPPDETMAATVPLVVRVCTGDVGQFRIRPVQAGGDSQP